jgi:hypothetical protein
VANNKNPNQKQPGEKEPGTFHFNPGNMSGKTKGAGKKEAPDQSEAGRIHEPQGENKKPSGR